MTKFWKEPEWNYLQNTKEIQIRDCSVETTAFRKQCKDIITALKEPVKQESYKWRNEISKIESNRILASTLTWKSLEVFNPILTTRKILKLRINKFSWTRQRKEITDQTDTLKSGEPGKYRNITEKAYLQQKLLEP